MAEALGIASSIIAVLKLSQSVLKYGWAVTGGSREANALLMEITATRGFFETLKDSLEGMSIHTLEILAANDGPVQIIHTTIQELDARLQKFTSATGISKVVKTLKWPLDSKTTQDFVSLIERQKTLLGFALQNDHIALSKSIQGKTAETLRILESMKDGVENMKIKVDSLTESLDETTQEKIRSWLSILNPLASHSSINRAENTGDWFLDREEYKDWLSGKNQILFCCGIAGAGKSHLASLVIDDIQNNHLRDMKNGLAYIYYRYDFKEGKQQNAASSLGSLISQLITKHTKFPLSILNLYRSSNSGERSPNVSECLQKIQTLSQPYDKIYFVLDAIDECSNDPRDREDLIKRLKELPDNVQVMLTSRPIRDIENEFRDAIQVKIQAQHSDIEKYVSARLQREKSFIRHIKADPSLRPRILSRILDSSQGMFLLPRLHMDELERKARRTKHELLQSLEQLPQKLDDTYLNAFQRIRSQEPEDFTLAQRVLSWVCFSVGPLNSWQIRHALAIEDGMVQSNEDQLLETDYILSVCAGLITCDNEIIRFVHYTTAEYFQRTWKMHLPRADFLLASVCLSHIESIYASSDGEYMKDFIRPATEILIGLPRFIWDSVLEFQTENVHKCLKCFPLLPYIARNLPGHVRFHNWQGSPDANLVKMTKELWQDAQKRIALRCVCTNIGMFTYQSTHQGNIFVVDFYPPLDDLDFAVYFRLGPHVAQLLSDMSKETDEAVHRRFQDSINLSICIAAFYGYDELIELLLNSVKHINDGMVLYFCYDIWEDELDVPLTPRRFQTDLSRNSHTYLKFTSFPSDVHRTWTAIECAVFKKHFTTLKILLDWSIGDKPIGVWLSETGNENPAYFAQTFGLSEAVKLLTEYGFPI